MTAIGTTQKRYASSHTVAAYVVPAILAAVPVRYAFQLGCEGEWCSLVYLVGLIAAAMVFGAASLFGALAFKVMAGARAPRPLALVISTCSSLFGIALAAVLLCYLLFGELPFF